MLLVGLSPYCPPYYFKIASQDALEASFLLAQESKIGVPPDQFSCRRNGGGVGSGKPANIYDQINRYVQAANGFQDAHGYWPDDDQIRPALEVVNTEAGEDTIIRSALLAAGSRLTKRERA